MERGRPTEYTPEIAREICIRLASGESLRHICTHLEDGTVRDIGSFPAISTVCTWNLDNRDGFTEQYARARKLQAELLADELFEVADDGSNDWQLGKYGPMVNGEAVQRSRLRVDTRKWYLSKVLPKIYGDKIVHEGSEDAPLVVKHIGKP